MCDFNLHFSLGFNHADIHVGATDVWESVLKGEKDKVID